MRIKKNRKLRNIENNIFIKKFAIRFNKIKKETEQFLNTKILTFAKLTIFKNFRLIIIMITILKRKDRKTFNNSLTQIIHIFFSFLLVFLSKISLTLKLF